MMNVRLELGESMRIGSDDHRVHFNKLRAPKSFWFTIYEALLPPAELLMRIISLGNVKLRKALHDRRGGIKSWMIGEIDQRPGVLIHAASYGEYEGVRPLVDALVNRNIRVAVSFSSPSAKGVVESTHGLWAYGYMPLDYLHRQVLMLGRLEPDVVMITKHDFWPNMVRAAAVLNIPLVLINANFHAGSRRFLPVARAFHRSFMKHIRCIWTVAEEDARRIEPLLSSGTELEALGDTRFDRVRQRVKMGEDKFRSLKEALASGPVIIAGSCWQPGERIVWRVMKQLKSKHPTLKLLVAPHEPDDGALSRNRDFAASHRLEMRLLSQWDGSAIGEDVLYIDEVGILAELYTIGWAAYVGGGFGRGVHSVIEPAAHGIPVAFGPNYHVSHEAGMLVEKGGGFVINSVDILEKLWGGWLDDPDAYKRAAQAAGEVVSAHEGVTDLILAKLGPLMRV